MRKNLDTIISWSVVLVGVVVLIWIAFPTTPQASEALNTVQSKPIAAQEPEPLYDVPLSADLQEHISKICESYDVDMPLVLAIIGQESNYRAEAVGDGGDSIGLMQIQPAHHRQRMDRLGITDLSDPYQNVTVGIDLLAELISKDNGTEWAVTAYNAGAGTADYNAAIGIRSEYTDSVMMLREMIQND